MSTWWDADRQKYRSSLVYKIFYVWTWPLTRWVLHHCLTPEQAHWFAIHVAIRTVGRIDRVWGWCVLLAVLPFLLIVRLLLFLPWFTCEPKDSSQSVSGSAATRRKAGR